MSDRGRLFVISGPSGAGKSTVVGKVTAGSDAYFFSVSATTRAPREGELEGVNYYFMDRQRFERMIEDNMLLEHAQYAGNYYGTPRAAVEEKLESGKNVLLDIEVQGAMQVKAAMPEAVLVFVTPPSYAELETRLRNRGTETEEKIRSRLRIARTECAMAHEYDYVIINDDADAAAAEFAAIVLAEHCRYDCRKDIFERM